MDEKNTKVKPTKDKEVKRKAVHFPTKPQMQSGDVPVLIINKNNSRTTVPWLKAPIPSQEERFNTFHYTFLPGNNTIPQRVWDGIKEQAGNRGYLNRLVELKNVTFDISGEIPQIHKMSIKEATATVNNTADLKMLGLFLDLEKTQRPDGPRAGMIKVIEKQLAAVKSIDKKAAAAGKAE